jgi:hypothetical protein
VILVSRDYAITALSDAPPVPQRKAGSLS